MPSFFVADLSPQGELRELTEYDSASLQQIEVAAQLMRLCSDGLIANADTLEMPLTQDGTILIRWRATAPGTGVLTVRTADGQLVSISVIATGQNPEADQTTLEVLQKHLVRQLHQTPHEPAFDLLQLKQRPLLATMTFAGGTSPDQPMILALADRAFAAAYLLQSVS